MTEYRYLSSSKKANYYFEVDYMSSREFKALLHDLVCGYQVYHNPDYDPGAFVRTEGLSKQEFTKERAERSAATLNSLFGGCTGYSESILLWQGPNSTPRIVEELEGMVKHVQQQRPRGPTSSKYSATAATIDDLASQLDIFSRMTSQDKLPILWPFVSIIRVYLKSLVLRSGLILADLPGKSARRKPFNEFDPYSCL